MKKGNALTELADHLLDSAFILKGINEDTESIIKAVNIINELAKANPDRWPMCVQAVIDCREIAEKGVK